MVGRETGNAGRMENSGGGTVWIERGVVVNAI